MFLECFCPSPSSSLSGETLTEVSSLYDPVVGKTLNPSSLTMSIHILNITCIQFLKKNCTHAKHFPKTKIKNLVEHSAVRALSKNKELSLKMFALLPLLLYVFG